MADVLSPAIRAQGHMLRTAYIHSGRQDLFWFIALPFLAIAAGLATQQWLDSAATAIVAVWITIPHHFASWLRTYGIAEERREYRDRLIIGPIFLFTACLLGFSWAPITTAALVILWDHQHSIMQQHGFARIYDFRGRTGAPSTGRFDLILGWVLFSNMLLTSSMFVVPLVHELHKLNLPVTAEGIRLVQTCSWSLVVGYMAIYLGHIVWSWKKGYAVNPMKYVFIAASYFLWYFCAWHVSNVLVWLVAHRIMHGLQYIVMVYWYMQRQTSKSESTGRLVSALVRPGNILMFVVAGVMYSLLFHFLTGGEMGAFLFNWAQFPTMYDAIPRLGFPPMVANEAYPFVAVGLLNAFGLTHYYFDSFIWKVSSKRTQGGLS